MQNSRFLNLGVQYFILARSTVFFGLQPICGNIYHLAFELLLKAALHKKYTSKELKDKFGHKLLVLWSEYKSIFPNQDLEKFDELIEDIERWEAIRYMDFPEKITAMGFTIDFDRKIRKRVKKNMVKLKKNGQDHYSFMFDDADEFFSKILSLIPVNPNFLKTSLIKKEAHKIYHLDNKYPFCIDV